jgi:hypothetical protein
MQLKLKRSLKEGGMLTKTTSFVLDGRVSFSAEETAAIDKFKWSGMVLYDSEAEQGTKTTSADSWKTAWAKGVASAGRLKIKLSPGTLIQGFHFETTNLSESVLAEETIIEVCENLRNYFTHAQTYNGSENVLEITGSKTVVTV